MDQNTSQFNDDFIKSHYEVSDEAYFVEFDVRYLEKLLELHNNLTIFTRKIPNGKSQKDFI